MFWERDSQSKGHTYVRDICKCIKSGLEKQYGIPGSVPIKKTLLNSLADSVLKHMQKCSYQNKYCKPPKNNMTNLLHTTLR